MAITQYTPGVRAVAVQVRSRTRPGLSHQVVFASCDCEDFYWDPDKGKLDPETGEVKDPYCWHIREAYRLKFGWTFPEE